jgi:hypothetical protein
MFHKNSASGKEVGYGGGIFNTDSGFGDSSTLTLINSAISYNIASGDAGSAGGGIYNGDNNDTLTLTNSTVFGNTAMKGNGGGIADGDQNGTTTLTNSTFSGNAAMNGGGIYALGSRDSIIFCTIYGNSATGNGGDVWTGSYPSSNQPKVQIRNSIVVGDPAHPGSDIVGMLTSNGYNLFQDTSSATFDPATRTQHGTDIALSVKDLTILFASPVGLWDNGGPTKTLMLAPNSLAVDQIPLDACHINGITTDQRGMKRPDGNESACDIGAYEYVDVHT